jgi:hypothetical protein
MAVNDLGALRDVVADLLHRTAEDHHIAFKATDGAEADRKIETSAASWLTARVQPVAHLPRRLAPSLSSPRHILAPAGTFMQRPREPGRRVFGTETCCVGVRVSSGQQSQSSTWYGGHQPADQPCVPHASVLAQPR